MENEWRGSFMVFYKSLGIAQVSADSEGKHGENTWWHSDSSCHAVDVVLCAPPSPYIRRTLGCRRRKQGLSPCTEPFPSLVLNRAAHNKSRQWAMLNYSGAQKIAATDEAEPHQKQWEFRKAKKVGCLRNFTKEFVFVRLWKLLIKRVYTPTGRPWSLKCDTKQSFR